MSEIKDWSTTAANNNSSPPNGWPENMQYNQVNDTARENMAVQARWYKDTNGTLTSGGSNNAYTLTPNRTVAAYTDGDVFVFEANHSNTDAATLNVSSLGAKSIVLQDGDPLVGGEIVSGGRYALYYDGTNFQIFSPSFNAQRIFYKTADQTSTASAAVDNHLTTTIESSTTYYVEFNLYIDQKSTSNPNIAFSFRYTGGVTGPTQAFAEPDGTTVVSMESGSEYTVTLANSINAGSMIKIQGFLYTNSAGTMTLWWQGGTTSQYHILKQGSSMTITKLG